eukprot:TRINITY_DN14491_c0_g1_i1.p1 TRINITY_DN14491_c0_g1~~TRINITY_DN14491_c0_g1_i1.p1  ORF type:complete len:366 (+),score=87.97 TRINITY_DN14491_c0_g1_i1:81-1100(+)
MPAQRFSVDPASCSDAAGATTHHLADRLQRSAKSTASQPVLREDKHRGKSTQFGEQHITRSDHEGTFSTRPGKQLIETHVKSTHLSPDLAPPAEFERRPHLPKPHAGDVPKNHSICPWQPSEHPEMSGRRSKASAELPERHVHGRSKGAGLAPSWPGHQAAAGPVPDRFPLDKRGRPNPVQIPHKKQVPDARLRSASADDCGLRRGRRTAEVPVTESRDHPKGGKQLVDGVHQRSTSLFGAPPDQTGASPVRSRSASPDRFRFEAPYSTEHSRAPSAAASPSRGRAHTPDGRAGGGAPFDSTWDPARHRAMDVVGKPRSFKPSTRIFSQEDTRQKIWGA